MSCALQTVGGRSFPAFGRRSVATDFSDEIHTLDASRGCCYKEVRIPVQAERKAQLDKNVTHRVSFPSSPSSRFEWEQAAVSRHDFLKLHSIITQVRNRFPTKLAQSLLSCFQFSVVSLNRRQSATRPNVASLVRH